MALTQREQNNLDELKTLITNNERLPSADDLFESMISNFNSNSQEVLQSKGTPLNCLLRTLSIQLQVLYESFYDVYGRFLYTQTQGDDLSIVASNFGYERIEAKNSQIVANITANKDLEIPAETIFEDGLSQEWVSKEAVSIAKDETKELSLKSSKLGLVRFVTPLKLKNSISGVISISPLLNTLVVGREQETDIELKSRINKGVEIQGSDYLCETALRRLPFVISAICKSNYESTNITFNGVDIAPNKRFVALLVSSRNITEAESSQVAQTILDNSLYFNISNKPDKVGKFFGITQELLPKPIAEGGADVIYEKGNENILVRCVQPYGNCADVFFRLAHATQIQIKVEVSYKSSYSITEKSSLISTIKRLSASAFAESVEVGGILEVANITHKIKSDVENIQSRINILSVLIKRKAEEQWSQFLMANSFEYFELYATQTEQYAGIEVVEFEG